MSGSVDNTLKLWQVATGRELRTFQGHSDYVNAVAFSPDGQLALSGSDDYTLKLWQVATGRELRTFQGHSYDVTAVAFSPDGQLALSGSLDNTLKLWQVATGRELRTFQGHSSYVTAVAFSPNGQLALSGSLDNTLKLWQVSTGRELRTFRGHSKSVEAVAFSPDGQLALSGSDDNTLKLWQVATGRELRTFQGHSDEVEAVAFSPDGQLALSGSGDSTTRLWQVDTGKELAKMVAFKDGEWATTTATGFYNASANGEKYINVRVKGNQLRDIKDYRTLYYRPNDAIQLAIQGVTPQTLAQATQKPKKIPPPLPPQKRLALIIGNAEYQGYQPLKNPVNDATDLANVLKQLHFEVMLETNLNYAQMEEAIFAFYDKLLENPGVGLFYFAGHGVQYEGESYLIPVDAKRLLKNIRHLRSKAVAASYVLDTMKATSSEVNLLILDACRNAPSFVRSLATTRGELDMPGLAPLKELSNSLVAYAASPGGLSKDGDGRNSPYVTQLKKWIAVPDLTINQVLKRVRKGVLKETDGEQSPGYYDELTEDFYFNKTD
ncbi:MAG: hypothetical protein DRR19_04485 [Candidatus Parabeggiatoa sp. nov. 1]|nr:MAG: hypothetical protein DRR19_04485 [Gammaproteobacteria bacterium]